MPQECEKLYYADSLLTRFEAVVTGCEEHDGSYLITLDLSLIHISFASSIWGSCSYRAKANSK